ncbi:hypothetical protein BH11CYA1_BH11CYA1_46480 [soil metagenome]
MYTTFITLAIIGLVLLAGYFAFRYLAKHEMSAEPTHIIQSGKDRSWNSPVFSSFGPFFIKPWLQPGLSGLYSQGNQLDRHESVQVMFHVLSDKGQRKEFVVEVELAESGQKWRVTPDSRLITIHGVPEQVQFSAKIDNLPPGALFNYRVLMGGHEIFSASARARKGEGDAFRAIIFGDMGNGSPGQRKLAYQLGQPGPAKPVSTGIAASPRAAEPATAQTSDGELTTDNAATIPFVKPQGADLIVTTGDVVYQHGRFAEYLSKFFSVYQSDVAASDRGANLLSNTVTVSCVGNHDMAKLDPETLVSFDDYPDLMAFFALWSLPLNGPNNSKVVNGSGLNLPPLAGDGSALRDFLNSAGERYPRMANFAYDYGNAHFLFLDANSYMDWTDESMRRWVDDDLKAVAADKWKIVILHQPPFTSNVGHQREQGMRFLSDIFERNGVNVVFCGHAHVYERSFPLKFTPDGGIARSAQLEGGFVLGKIVLDKAYDSTAKTKPDGVIYIVTGGGGAKLDSRALNDYPSAWQPFTHKLVGDRHSFTLADFGSDRMEVAQYDSDGNELDRFVITR